MRCNADTLRIFKTAAKLIKSDIRSVNQIKDSYASCHELSSVEEAVSFLPESLQLMLSTSFTFKGEQVKLASIGQAIMQATRPREISAPLQVGLGIQLHHHFASKFRIDSLNKHEFCCSYSEVIKFERNAAVTQGTDIPGFESGHFVQYIADNVDHNIRIIDGMNIFHGMGMTAATTPATKRNPRCWNIKHVQRILGRDICTNLLFAHAILGCDTISRVISLGKGSALKYIRFDSYFTKQARIFLDENATEYDIINAGKAALVSLYKGTVCEILDDLRLLRFHQKVATSTTFVQPEHLPPTSSAAKYHSLHVFYQVQVWEL